MSMRGRVMARTASVGSVRITVGTVVVIDGRLNVDWVNDHRSWLVDYRFRLHVDSRSNAAGQTKKNG